MLFQVKTFFQAKYHLRVQTQKQKQAGQESIKPFSIVILGYRSFFSDALPFVIIKIQRNSSWLHLDASVTFLDLESAAEDDAEFSRALERRIAAASETLVSRNANTQGLLSLRKSRA